MSEDDSYNINEGTSGTYNPCVRPDESKYYITRPDELKYYYDCWNKSREFWLTREGIDIGGDDVFDACWKEGEEEFNKYGSAEAEAHNPYTNLKGSSSERRIPWYGGFRCVIAKYSEDKYKISDLQNSIRKLVEDHGLSINYTDEYGTPYIESPEGYTTELC